MRSKCEDCGDCRLLNDDGICVECEQDRLDLADDRHELEDWQPEDDMEAEVQ